MADKLTEELLRRILAGETVDGMFLGQGNGGAQIGGDAGNEGPRQMDTIYRPGQSSTMRNSWDAWNTSGDYLGQGTADSDLASGLKFLGTALAGYYGANALGGAGGGAGGAGGASGAVGGAGGGAGGGAATFGNANLLGAANPYGMAGGALESAAADSLAAGGLNAGTFGTGASIAGGNAFSPFGGAAAASSIPDWLSKNLGGLAGAALGAASSQDQEQTTTRDPWGPAQPFLRQQIDQGMALSKQYADQPFSPQQQTAYNNFGGLLNAINGGAGGLLQGMSANASGANNYDRSNPRRQLTGSSFDLSGFAPGLLQFFPQSKG